MQSAWTERGSPSVPSREDKTTKPSDVGEGTEVLLGEVGTELEKEEGERDRHTHSERKRWRETKRGRKGILSVQCG